jgi:hypothetical protein
LHKDKAERAGGPIGFEEARFAGVVAGQQRGADDVGKR